MAASLTVINYVGTPITDFKNALNAKSLITEIKYEDADCLIFTTPLLPDSKVLKINLSTNVYIMYYGDAWTSAETITNPVQFSTRGAASTTTSLYCIADAGWFFMAWEAADVIFCGYVGALDNGDVIAAGFSSSNTSWHVANNICMNITKGIQMIPINLGISHTVTNNDGYLLKMPLMWYDPVTKKIVMNGAAPAKTTGLYLSGWVSDHTSTDLGASYYLSSSPGFASFSGTAYMVYKSSLLIEFTP